MAAQSSLPLLNDCHVRRYRSLMNRLHFFIHGTALLFLFYYRFTSLAQLLNSRDHSTPLLPALPHLLILIAEAIVALIWLLNQPSKWRPVVRTAYPEMLPTDDSLLPGIDVFVCTADPNKEPSVVVMNTVISALALDYPPNRLHVYLSDDGGSHVTLEAAREAWKFARFWVWFCNKYKVITRCPEAYFQEDKDHDGKFNGGEFLREEKEIKGRYEEFKSRVLRIAGAAGASRDHATVIEVIGEEDDHDKMPYFAYVAREKRQSQPHHFKAGALNVLLRVSATISNSPYILMLDCDMYCNDPSSARQAMCFHLDPKLSPNLAFVQFPQRFHNINLANDIYDGKLRYIWEKWEGMDGFKGPILSGSCLYVKREALYGTRKFQEDQDDLHKLKNCYGLSNEFIRSIYQNYERNYDKKSFDDMLRKELQLLASCSYEEGTKWGNEVGFRYFSVVEDYFLSFNLHCEGWTSAYVDPLRPCFLGTSPISLGDHMVQHMRWYSGLLQIGLSSFSPLLYGPLRMSLWQSICYGEFSYYAFYFIPLYVLAIVPQLCLLRGISLYPEVSSPYFTVFTFVFLSSQVQHLQEVLTTGHSLRAWWIEQRMWMINSLSPYLYAAVNAVQEKAGLKTVSFLLTSKVVDDAQEKRYQLGLYDFQAAAVFMVPLCTLYMINVASFVVACGRMLKGSGMAIQGFIPLFGMALHYPLLEGMVLRKDKGRVSPSVCLTSAAVCAAVICVASLVN